MYCHLQLDYVAVLRQRLDMIPRKIVLKVEVFLCIICMKKDCEVPYNNNYRDKTLDLLGEGRREGGNGKETRGCVLLGMYSA